MRLVSVMAVSAALACPVLAGCGGNGGAGGSSSATVTGSVDGQTLNASEAIWTAVGTGINSCGLPFAGLGNTSGALILITNVSGTCSLNGDACSVQPNALTLALVPWTASSGTPAALAPSTFTVFPLGGATAAGLTSGAFAKVFATDSVCALATNAPGAVSGTLTLTVVSGNTLQGAFNLTLADGSNVVGSFNAVNCTLNTAPFCTGSFGCTGQVSCG